MILASHTYSDHVTLNKAVDYREKNKDDWSIGNTILLVTDNLYDGIVLCMIIFAENFDNTSIN